MSFCDICDVLNKGRAAFLWMNNSKEEVEKGVQNYIYYLIKINDKWRSKVVLTKVFDTYLSTKDFIGKSLEDVCSRANLPRD